jgi:hypothetical protein
METWSYQPKKFHDKKGGRWHFMFHSRHFPDLAPDEQPYALYFRDDERTVFGVLRFERAKDNPYRSLDTVTRKIMDDAEFRATLLDEDSKKMWKGR